MGHIFTLKEGANMSIYELLIEPLRYEFMMRALVGIVSIGLLCAVLGTFVVLKNLAFIGEGLAHSTLGGLALAALLGSSLYPSAAIFAICVALLIGYISEIGGVSLDASIGILFSTATALGILLIGFAKFNPGEIVGFLFGNVLAIRPADLWIVATVAGVVIAAILFFYKELAFAAFDGEMAMVCGVPTRLLDYLLLAAIAVTVVVSVQAIGIVLITALLVIPASAAMQIARRLPSIIALSAIISVLSGITGLYVSFYLNVPSGASIIFVSAIIFVLAVLTSPRRSFAFPLHTVRKKEPAR